MKYSRLVLTSLVIIYIVFLFDLYHYSRYLHDSSFLIPNDFSLFFTSNANGCHVISYNIIGKILLIIGPIVGSYCITTYFRNSGILQNQLVEYYNVDQEKENPTLNFEYPDSSNLHAKIPDLPSRIIFYLLLIFLILIPTITTLFIFGGGNNVLELQVSFKQMVVIILYSWFPSLLVYTTRIVRYEITHEYSPLMEVLFYIAIIFNIYTIFAINSTLYCV